MYSSNCLHGLNRRTYSWDMRILVNGRRNAGSRLYPSRMYRGGGRMDPMIWLYCSKSSIILRGKSAVISTILAPPSTNWRQSSRVSRAWENPHIVKLGLVLSCSSASSSVLQENLGLIMVWMQFCRDSLKGRHRIVTLVTGNWKRHSRLCSVIRFTLSMMKEVRLKLDRTNSTNTCVACSLSGLPASSSVINNNIHLKFRYFLMEFKDLFS